MYFEITVSRNGQHLFATSERSLLGREKADALYDVLAIKFPGSDGYRIELNQMSHTGKTLRIRQANNE